MPDPSPRKPGRGWLTAALRFVARRPRLVAWTSLSVVVLAVLAAVAPVVDLVAGALSFVGRLLEPLLDSPVGRLVLLNLLLFGGVVWLFLGLRHRLGLLRTGLTLERHLDGIRALCRDDRDAARAAFSAVARARTRPPEEHPGLHIDARLKLARLAIEDGEPGEASRLLLDVRDRDLPVELRRSLTQLRLLAEVQLGETLPEELERAVRAGLEEFRDDLVLLELLTDVLRRAGRFDAVLEIGRRLLKRSGGMAARRRGATLARDLLAAADIARDEGSAGLDRAEAWIREAVDLDPEDPATGCVLGDLLAVRGDLLAALQAYGATASVLGLERAAELLDRHPGRLGPREILAALPFDDTVVLVAREMLRSGDRDAARRAVRMALRSPVHPGFIASMLDEVREALGEVDGAPLALVDPT